MVRRWNRREFVAAGMATLGGARCLPPVSAAPPAGASSAAQLPAEPLVRQLVFIQRGTIPVILSAPHGGRRPLVDIAPRTGAGVRRFVTVRDENTAEIAQAVGTHLESWLKARPWMIVAQYERRFVDANRPAEAAYESELAKPYYDSYHQALRAACDSVLNEFRHGILLDIHGQAAHPDQLLRGTNNGRSVAHLVGRHGRAAIDGPNSILGRLSAVGYDVHPTPGNDDREKPDFDGGYIVTEYGAERPGGVDAMQLEFGRKYRLGPDMVTQTSTDVAKAIVGFCEHYLPVALPKPAAGTRRRR